MPEDGFRSGNLKRLLGRSIPLVGRLGGSDKVSNGAPKWRVIVRFFDFGFRMVAQNCGQAGLVETWRYHPGE